MAVESEPRAVRRRLPEKALKDFGGWLPIRRRAFFATPTPMSQPRDSFHDDQLINYLLGCLPEEEAERLDEESIVDDELAARLRLVEDDLVDAYASGTLTGETLQRFESFYLTSPRRRRKAAFARKFLTRIDRPAQRLSAVPQPAIVEPPTKAAPPARTFSFSWAHAAAAVLLLGMSILLLQHVNLRRELNEARREVSAASERANAMSVALEEQRKAVTGASQALADARAARPLATIALVLRPQTRGVGPVPVISIAAGSRTVPLDLEFEAAGPASYDVALKDPATNRIIWRSAPLSPQREGSRPVVSVGLPAALLKSQHYALDLFALHAEASPEFVGTYAFEVARQ